MPASTKNGRRILIVASILCAVAIFASLLAAGIALTQRFNQTDALRRTSHEVAIAVCNSAVDERTALRALVINSDKKVGTRKAAGFQYYKEHPEELALAHKQNRDILTFFLPPLSCTSAGKPYTPRR